MTDVEDNLSFGAELLKEIRSRLWYADECPHSGSRVFLDASSGSLRLKAMTDILAEESALPDQLGRDNPGSYHANEMLAKGVEDVKLFLGAKSGSIAPAMSSSHANFRVVNAVTSHVPGSNIVTTNIEHPSVADSTRYFAKLYNKEVRIAEMCPETGRVKTESILEKIDKNTSLLACIHASNMTGIVHDIKTIVTEARKINPELFVLIDGVRYAPNDVIDVEDLGVDAYVFGPYKVYCAKGIGYAYLSDRLSVLPHWSLAGKNDSDWILGSAEHATYAAFSACVDYICWIGSHFTDSTDRRELIVAGQKQCAVHIRYLLKRLLFGTSEIKGLNDMDHVTLYGMDDDISRRTCLVTFNLKGIDSYEGVKMYREKNIRVHNRVQDEYSTRVLKAMGTESVIRLSAAPYNTPDEIDMFLKATESFK